MPPSSGELRLPNGERPRIKFTDPETGETGYIQLDRLVETYIEERDGQHFVVMVFDGYVPRPRYHAVFSNYG